MPPARFVDDPRFRHVRRDGHRPMGTGACRSDKLAACHAMTVVSKADPLEYAEGAVWVVDGDADADTQFDALDLGAVRALLGP